MNIGSQKTKGFALAVAFWVFESFIHRFVQGEPSFEFLPSDPNELWMRVIICLLIILFGVSGDATIEQLTAKEEEKLNTFNALIAATHHILNNFTYKMTYFRVKMEDSHAFDDEVFELFDEMIESTTEQVNQLGSISDINPDSIEQSTYP